APGSESAVNRTSGRGLNTFRSFVAPGTLSRKAIQGAKSMSRETFAARAAKWSAAHWKTATFGWLVFVVAAIVVGSAAGSVPITFLILLFAFGAFVAAGIPVLLAFSAVLGSIGLAELSSHVMHASDATNSVMLLIGMAVGVDYSLFYIKREREERKAGHGRD